LLRGLATAAAAVLIFLAGRGLGPSGRAPTGSPGFRDPALLELHNAERPAKWEEMWHANTDPNNTPADNLDRIYAASAPNIKAVIDGLRAKGYADYQILTYLQERFGPHTVPRAKE
jgi:hypothetical protein